MSGSSNRITATADSQQSEQATAEEPGGGRQRNRRRDAACVRCESQRIAIEDQLAQVIAQGEAGRLAVAGNAEQLQAGADGADNVDARSIPVDERANAVCGADDTLVG